MLIILILIHNHLALLQILCHHLGYALRMHRTVIVMGQVLRGQGRGHCLMLHMMPHILMFQL